MTAISPSASYTHPAPAAVPYATPAPRYGPRAWAGAAVVFGGLCLIGLGGCFLIGVYVLTELAAAKGTADPRPLTGPEFVLMIALYVLAFASFAGATAMLVAGTRGLLRVMRA